MQALFEPARVSHGEKLVRGYRITCGNCGQQEAMACNSVAGRPNANEENRLAARKFTTAGWLIGVRVRDHRCPRCAELEIARHREDRLRKINGSHDDAPKVLHLAPALSALLPGAEPQQPEAQAPPELPALPAPEPPRVMGRDDRRVIWAKLDDVYASENDGYKPGWSDARVARDLNVPVDWVRVVRDENFGALDDNPETRAVVQEAREVLGEIIANREEVERLAGAFEQMQAAIAEARRLDARIVEITERLERLAVGPG